MRRHSLDVRTDRLARRLTGFDVPRDTYYWARLRVAIAERDLERTMERELTPAFRGLNEASRLAETALRRFADLFRPR
jgi:hypothetical protein